MKDKFLEKLINLIEVKKIIALVIIIVFCILSINDVNIKENFVTVATMIISFYFGQSTVRGTLKETDCSYPVAVEPKLPETPSSDLTE